MTQRFKNTWALPLLMLTLGALPAFSDTTAALSALDAAYKSGFYPGVVRYADDILRESPASPAAIRAAVFKGESLYRMGRLPEALAALEKLAPDTADLIAARSYWLGRIYSDRQDWQAALSAFFTCAQAAKGSAENESYYAYALLYAGDACRALSRLSAPAAPSAADAGRSVGKEELLKKALPLYSYVVEHGSAYSLADYERAALSLAEIELELGDHRQAASLCRALAEAPFSESGRYRLLLLEGDALSAGGDYKAAYRLYCRVLGECGESSLCAPAMVKACQLSSLYQKEVGEEPGTLLKQAEARLSAYPELLGECYLRLAIDAYRAGDREKAGGYFLDAEKAVAGREVDSIVVTAALYRAELAFAASGDSVQGARDALAALEKLTGARAPASESPLYALLAASRARFYGLSGDWKNCALQADLVLARGGATGDASSAGATSSAVDAAPTAASAAGAYRTAVYWKAVSLYQRESYQEVVSCIAAAQKSDISISSDVSLQSLYARALAQTGKLHEADQLFYALGEEGALDNDGTLDYAKSLLNGGYMISASTQAGKATGPEADYLAGLAAFNRRQWKAAADAFSKSLAAGTEGGLQQKYLPYARFYCGYAQYRSGRYQDAYRSLSAFLADSSVETHSLRFLALTTAVRSSVQAGNYSQAFPLAENAIRAAQKDSQKEEAVLLCAGVYADAGQYDKALTVLSSYTAGRTAFAFQCRYQTARIQSQKKDYAAADKTYAALAREKAAGLLAEEAAYRRGELAYSTGRFSDSIPLFDEYCRKWGEQGQYYDAALFFAAAALVKSGDSDRAILYYQRLDGLRTFSPYKYSAEKSLMELYKNQREFQKASSYAEKLLAAYGDQARDDGIAAALDELKKLELGYDEPTAAKEQEYDRLGKSRTPAGRAAGTQLAQLWVSSPIYRKRGLALAENLLSEQKNHLPEEASDALQNALLLAKSYRDETENLRAAETYLEAATYARQTGSDLEAAQSLYGAVEAFDAAGRYGDARATARELAKLYPDSRFVAAANKIVEAGE